MKIRKFYPSQVLRRLSGKSVSGIATAEKVAMGIGMRRARKAGFAVTVVSDEIDVHGEKQLGQVSNVPGFRTRAENDRIAAQPTKRSMHRR